MPTKDQIEAAAKSLASRVIATAGPRDVMGKRAGVTAADLMQDGDEMVTCNVPKQFKLRVNHDVELAFKPGVQDLPDFIAHHWYAVANGVTEYVPTKQPPAKQFKKAALEPGGAGDSQQGTTGSTAGDNGGASGATGTAGEDTNGGSGASGAMGTAGESTDGAGGATGKPGKKK